MAPIDFEKNIKEKLQGQELEPSPGAWERIASRLDAAPPRPGRNRLMPWIYGVAAAGVVLLGIRVFLATDSDPLPADTQEVAAPAHRDASGAGGGLSSPQGQGGSQAARSGEGGEKAPEGSGPGDGQWAASDTADRRGGPTESPSENGEARDATPRTDGQGLPETRDAGALAAAVSETEIDRQLDAVLREVTRLESGGITVTDAEIDSLLLAARERLAPDPLRMPGDPVDAMALLSEAEQELDQSFREELFDKLKNGFMRVRTAVADRNN